MAGVRGDLAAFRNRLEVTYLVGLPMAELERRMASLPSHSIVLYVSMLRDGAGQQFDSINALSRLSRITSAPIYGMFDTALGYGIVGGSLISFELVGARMGQMAQRVLAGEKPASIPFERRAGALVFDARQLRRWRLSEARLPPGAELRFREPTIWDRYHWQIIGGILLILVESVLLAAVLVHRLRRRRAETELRASYQQIQHLAGRLITAQETERSHIARELHDNFNQQLAALAIAHSTLKRRLPPGSSDLREEVDRLQQQAVALSDAIRQLSHELHPGVLQHVGLLAALRAHCEQFSRDRELEVSFQSVGELRDIPPEVSLCLYRVTQEALHNVAQHAAARRAEVTLRRTAAGLELSVRDDGTGFDPNAEAEGGLGLISIDERVRLVRGAVQIVTGKKRGTELQVRVPLDAPWRVELPAD
jgi:signal transduction histidine kinase